MKAAAGLLLQGCWTADSVEEILAKATNQPAEQSSPACWLRWLEPLDAQVVLGRTQGARWKTICWRLKISRATAYRRYRYGLAVIACRLNGEPFDGSRRKMLGASV